MDDILLDKTLLALYGVILTLQNKGVNNNLDAVLRLTDLYRDLLKERDRRDGL